MRIKFTRGTDYNFIVRLKGDHTTRNVYLTAKANKDGITRDIDKTFTDKVYSNGITVCQYPLIPNDTWSKPNLMHYSIISESASDSTDSNLVDSGIIILTVNIRTPDDFTPDPLVPVNADLKYSKMYVALLSQAGTGNPSATVLNTAGTIYLGAITWTRTSTGVYNGQATGKFPANKILFDAKIDRNNLIGDEWNCGLSRVDDDNIKLQVWDTANDLIDGFNGLQIEIITFA